jgi:lipid II:glycine glycyltransferase (peptidoglycan interpeptide bridge formation enzyme)
MARVGASPAYFFDRAYVERLRSALTGRTQLLVARNAGRMLAAAIFVETAGTVQYHLSGTRDDCTHLRPTKPLLWEAARWAKARGNHVLHLGGGVGGQEDSLFQFKAGFSARRHAFHTWRLVIDKAAYDRCSALARERAGGAAPGDFIPAYRAG